MADENTFLEDSLFDEAVLIVLEANRGSVSLLQRKLTIGYARAFRMIERMAFLGVVGGYEGCQTRKVTMTLEEYKAL